jgi:hypothetical protein
MSLAYELYSPQLRPLQAVALAIFQTSTTPVPLGGTLFVLHLDLAIARRDLAVLAEGVSGMTVNVAMYRATRERIMALSSSWTITLSGLALIALYNAIGMLLWLSYENIEYDRLYPELDNIMYDLFIVAVMAKEACLLFTFTFLVLDINDTADDFVTDVYQWIEPATSSGESTCRRGLESTAAADEEMATNSPDTFRTESISDKDLQRLALLVQATLFLGPRSQGNRGSICQRVASPKAGGIAFNVLGVRWTSRYVWALFVAFCTSIIALVVKRVLKEFNA